MTAKLKNGAKLKMDVTSKTKLTSTASCSTSASTVSDTFTFYLEDFNRALFPLKTNQELIRLGEPEIKGHIEKCLDEHCPTHSFLPQHRVYAAKPGAHLRRTVKLDAVAEYYIYDVVYRNRACFRKPHSTGRTHYGYRIEGGVPIAPSSAYKAFKGAISEYGKSFSHFMSLDIASYFNSIYHHDIVSWFSELGALDKDAEGLGQLLREINSGRSLDCLPQGLYPTKMIGNDFLRFIDNYHGIKSDKLVRFMDDIYIFSNDAQKVSDDFQIIQRLLGDKGLSVNPQKTRVDAASHVTIESEIDDVKQKLLKRRRTLITEGYDESGKEIVKEMMVRWPLDEKELAYIDELLSKGSIEEEDAELILTIMRENAMRVERRLPDIIKSYPHLAKNVYNFCSGVSKKDLIADIILSEATDTKQLMEFQLFWFGAILEEHLLETTRAPALISTLFDHRSATPITKAKILEIADNRFGLQERRNEYLVSGQSDWLAWSSAVGSRRLKKISRNHKFKYLANSSQFNHLLVSILQKT